MSYWRLILSLLAQRRSQIVISTLSIIVAFFLFCLLMCLRESLMGHMSVASAYRLRAQGTGSVAALLPLAYAQRIARIEGVDYIGYAYAAPAAYQNDPAHLLLQAVPADHFFDLFPELAVGTGARRDFLADKSAILAGADAVERYGWTVGQNIMLQTNIPNAEGTGDWSFRLVGIYDSAEPTVPKDLTFVRYDYFNDGRADARDQVLGYIVRISAVDEAQQIAARIDAEFATSSPRLRTQPENVAIQKQLGQFSSFATAALYIASAVFVSVLLLTFNVFFQRNQLRRKQWATLRAIGFGRTQIFGLIVAECAVVVISGAGGGVLLGSAASRALRPHVSGILAGFNFPVSAIVVAALITAFFTAACALIPALLATRTDVAASLRASR